MNKTPIYTLLLLIILASLLSTSLSRKLKSFGTFHLYSINLNESSSGVLQLLPGVGKKTALKIILEREFERFENWEDFRNRIHISNSKFTYIQVLSKIE